MPGKLLPQISKYSPTHLLQVFAQISPQWHLHLLKTSKSSTPALLIPVTLLYFVVVVVVHSSYIVLTDLQFPF